MHLYSKVSSMELTPWYVDLQPKTVVNVGLECFLKGTKRNVKYNGCISIANSVLS